MNAVRAYHQSAVSEENLHKLWLSKSETEGLFLRDIHCPYCGYLVERVFSDATGHGASGTGAPAPTWAGGRASADN